jgi:exopolysaccharide production protein ExoY
MLKSELVTDRRNGQVAVRHAEVALGGTTKRVLDVITALVALLLLWPLIVVALAATWISSPGPLIFGHERIGFNGRKFRCLKIRTMVTNADVVLQNLLESDPGAAREWEEGQKLRNDPRVHRVGAILRKTSIDELPQLWNVIKGDMSIVGPRPIVAAEVKRYSHNFAAYTATRPGITGLWQVMGRSDCSYDERVSFDLAYVSGWSLVRDVWIMIKTFHVVLSRSGSY